MDRASGSGVFARDADALIDLLELALPSDFAEEAKIKYGQFCVPYRMEFTLREFARIEPVDCFFSYPLIKVDEDGLLYEAKPADFERTMNRGREMGTYTNIQNKIEAKSKLLSAIRRDIETNGERKSRKYYANELGCTEKTISGYVNEDKESELFKLFHGDNVT